MAGTTRLRRLAATAVAVVAAAGLAACSDTAEPSSSGAAEPVKIGVFADRTAYLADPDSGVLEGVELAADALNAQGGILGRQVEIVAEDTAADPQRSVSAVQKLLTQEGCVALIGGFSSASTGAVAPIAAQQSTPLIVASVPAPDPTWTFSTLPAGRYQVAAMVGYLEEQGISSVGILHDPTPYNKALLGAAEKGLGDAGIRITDAQQHAVDAVDLRPQVTSLLGGDPGAILKFSTGPTEIVAAKALAQSGTSIPLLIGLDTLGIVEQATDAYSKVLMVSSAPQVYEALPAGERSDALTAFMESYTGETDPTYVGRGWDALNILAAAMEKAGTTEGEAVRTALDQGEEYAGTTATYRFGDPSHFGIATNPLYLARFGGDSPEIVVTPES